MYDNTFLLLNILIQFEKMLKLNNFIPIALFLLILMIGYLAFNSEKAVSKMLEESNDANNDTENKKN